MKRHATLLEVLIAISLVTILLLGLMGLYKQVIWAEVEARKQQRQNFQFLYAQHRLQEVLPRTIKDSFFYTTDGDQTLVFVYNNGMDAGKDFSNDVIGKLYVNESGQLKLITWPSIDRHPEWNPPMIQEVLLEGVGSIDFSFFRPPRPTRKDKPVDPEAEAITGKWFASWSIDDDDIPALVRIDVQIEQEKNPIIFSFFLQNTKESILYL